MRSIIFLLVCAVLAWPAAAKQTHFSKAYRGAEIRFTYQWYDAFKKPQKLNFSLNINDVNQAKKEFQAFDNKKGNALAYEAVQNYIKPYNTNGREVRLVRKYGGFDVEGKGYGSADFAAIQRNIQRVQKEAYDTYISTSYYTYLDDKTIMPDHKRIAKRYVRAMAPVAAAIRAQTQGKSPREVINYTLAFLQNIPYDQLQSRYTSNGAGFQTPYALLETNRGDCDTKAVAMAAIMRNLFPRVRMIMVYVPKHAFIGFAFKPGAGDKTLKAGATTYVLADPTGPSIVPIGVADSQSLAGIRNGQYSYQEVPF